MTKANADVLEAAKQAVAVKDWTTARRLLAPLVAENPDGVPGFFLARAELELGRPEVAAPLVTAFRAYRPHHVGSAVLAARIHLANGELEEAQKLALTVLELEPDNVVAPGLLERIAAATVAKDLRAHIEVIDARYREARAGAPSADLLRAARTLHDIEPGPDWVRDTDQAKIAYFHHARDLGDALLNYHPDLIDVAARFDFLRWPQRIQQHLGESVLDVGCGFGGLGIGYLVAGAASYTGIDPAMELDSTRARNKRTRRWDDMGITPREIADTLPAIRLVPSAVETHRFDRTFDTIVLHNVSEHLPDPDRVLARLTDLCHPGSKVVLLHHNFYSWTGHKRQPRSPAQLDERNAEHRQVYDWGHVTAVPDLPRDHDFLVNLNRLRPDELRETVARHFVVTEWEEVLSDAATCARLTPVVFERVRDVVPDITERELNVNSVFCVARPRG
jgi:SAM-dependent methyltransferase